MIDVLQLLLVRDVPTRLLPSPNCGSQQRTFPHPNRTCSPTFQRAHSAPCTFLHPQKRRRAMTPAFKDGSVAVGVDGWFCRATLPPTPFGGPHLTRWDSPSADPHTTPQPWPAATCAPLLPPRRAWRNTLGEPDRWHCLLDNDISYFLPCVLYSIFIFWFLVWSMGVAWTGFGERLDSGG